MANTFSQITIHSIFAVKYRENFILNNWRDDLHRYISGTIKGEGSKPLAVGGWKDHVHILFGFPVDLCLSNFIGSIKANSSRWINASRLTPGKFNWQTGYAAFSISKNHRDSVINYIINQEQHHRSITFKEEYLEFLHENEIQYDEKYLFQFFD